MCCSANGRVVIDFRIEHEELKDLPKFIPDGVKLDVEGKVWVSLSAGGAVIRIDAEYVSIICDDLLKRIPSKQKLTLYFQCVCFYSQYWKGFASS